MVYQYSVYNYGQSDDSLSIDLKNDNYVDLIYTFYCPLRIPHFVGLGVGPGA